MDETYQIYLNRVMRLTLPTTHSTQLQNIQESPKFSQGKPTPFPGYSIISPIVESDTVHVELYQYLKDYQQQLLPQVESGLIVPVPATSFHFTLADLIWENAYRDAIEENYDFEQQLYECISSSFQEYQQSIDTKRPLYWQLLGLIIRPRSIGVCLVPKDEASYNHLAQLRRFVYQNPGLIALGIEQQYHFTAHITLGYFSNIPTDLNRDRLTTTLATLNEKYVDEKAPTLTIKEAKLLKFDDMTNFYQPTAAPILEF